MTPDRQQARRDAQARNRYFVITLARITGAALALFGMVITAGRIQGVPPAAGYAVLLIGLIDILLVPRMLARRWRTPPQP